MTQKTATSGILLCAALDHEPATSRGPSLSRRDFTALNLAGLGALVLSACHAGPYEVRVPRPKPLGQAVLTVQMSGRKSPIGFISPRKRYAKKLGPKLHNRLIEEGFVIKKTDADLHLHVQVYEVTTGSTAREARCDLLVELYDKWPGDLTLPRAQPPADLRPIFSMMVSAVEHVTNQGYPREELTQRAAEKCLSDVVSYLVRSKTHPMT